MGFDRSTLPKPTPALALPMILRQLTRLYYKLFEITIHEVTRIGNTKIFFETFIALDRFSFN